MSEDAPSPSLLPRELLKKVRKIELRAKGMVDSVFSGQYASAFKGQGMEFAEVREYQYGDDVRSIDWNVTARMGHPYIKCFEEERELTLMLVVDASGSLSFGSKDRFKGEVAAEISALLSLLAIRNNDRVGALFFTDRIEKFISPRKGKKHVLRLIREILAFEPEGKGTDLSLALETVCRVLPRRAIVMVLSDFHIQDDSRALKVAGRQHDLVALSLLDPREEELPEVGLIHLEDAETGETLLVDSNDPKVRAFYQKRVEARRAHRQKTFREAKVDEVQIPPGGDYVRPLMRFFKGRSLR